MLYFAAKIFISNIHLLVCKLIPLQISQLILHNNMFQITWEQRQLKARQKKVVIPNLDTVIDLSEKSFEVLSTDSEFEEAPTSNLHKTDVPVEELLKRVALLRHELGIKDESPEE